MGQSRPVTGLLYLLICIWKISEIDMQHEHESFHWKDNLEDLDVESNVY